MPKRPKAIARINTDIVSSKLSLNPLIIADYIMH